MFTHIISYNLLFKVHENVAIVLIVTSYTNPLYLYIVLKKSIYKSIYLKTAVGPFSGSRFEMSRVRFEDK